MQSRAGIPSVAYPGRRGFGVYAQEFNLSARAGVTYTVFACAALGTGPFSNDSSVERSLAVRFIAYNTSPDDLRNLWRPRPGGIVTLGTVAVSGDEWSTYTVGRWTADADYDRLACIIASAASSSDPTIVRIGRVMLQE